MKLFKKVIYSIFFGLILIILLKSDVYAGQTLKYSEVNFTKYPGYKSLVDNLKNAYSNWNFLFYDTGLNWNDVIEGEYKGHGGSPYNLIPANNNNYDGDWLCPICGTKTYDSQSWCCVSKDAIGYMMDPRNSINSTDIFQFQSLSSTTYSRSAIEKMVDGTFLDWPGCVNAIIEASENNNMSPYHITARILQEQGNNGSYLSSGEGYKVDGKVQYKGYYNVFNIEASGNSIPTIVINGLSKAKAEGWTSLEKSIIGGAKFLSTNYIGRGQNTLYFQKFNVVSPTYYSHQYMQNIMAAQTEGYSMRTAYANSGILNSKFDFIIPLYNNMPSKSVPRPLTSKDNYEGVLNTNLKSLKVTTDSKGNYIYGEFYASETINGKLQIPKDVPNVTLKTSANKTQKATVALVKENLYSFKVYTDGLATDVTASLQVELCTSRNTSSKKKQNMKTTSDDFLGFNSYGRPFSYSNKNGELVLQLGGTYSGNIDSTITSIAISNNQKGNYIYGKIDVYENINNKNYKLGDLPIITLKLENGKSKQANVKLFSGNTYSFEIYTDGLVTGVNANLLVEISNQFNTSKKKSEVIKAASSKFLGVSTYGRPISYSNKNGELILKLGGTFIGNIDTELKSIAISNNSKGNYIYGKVDISQTIDSKSYNPTSLPTLTLKLANGKSKQAEVKLSSGKTYSFEIYTDGLVTGVDARIYVALSDQFNTGKNKSEYIKIASSKFLGVSTYGRPISYTSKNGEMLLNLGGTYEGNINTELKSIGLSSNSKGNYIYGKINISENINGKAYTPSTVPILTLKLDNGKSTEADVKLSSGNTYSFEIYTDGLVTGVDSKLVAKLSSEFNTSKSKSENVKTNSSKSLGITTYGKPISYTNNKGEMVITLGKKV